MGKPTGFIDYERRPMPARPPLVRLHDISVEASGRDAVFRTASSPAAQLWLDDARLTGPGRTVSKMWTEGWGGVYVTDISLTDSRDGIWATLARNANLERIGSDPFSGSRVVINSSVIDVDRQGTDFHPDIYQIYGPGTTFDNLIVYGLGAYDAKAQGIFARGCDAVNNSAFVNVAIECVDDTMLSQWRVPSNHVLFWHVTHLSKPFWWREDPARGVYGANWRNVHVQASVFETILSEVPLDEVTFSDNHYISTTGLRPGSEYTTGDPRLVDRRRNNFLPAPGSPLLNRIGVPLWQATKEPSSHVGAAVEPPQASGSTSGS